MTIQNARPLPGAFRLLADACSFYVRHWQILVGISLIPVLFSLPAFWVKKEAATLLIILAVVSLLTDFISKLAFLGALTQSGGPEKGFKGAFYKGIRFLFPFIWVSILSGLASLGGFVLLIIPGLLLSVWLSTSSYVLFTENRRGLQALTGSWHYVRGYFWAVLGRLLFLMVLLMLVGMILGFLTGDADLLIALKGGETLTPATPILGQIINLIWNDVFFIPLSLIYSYEIYKSLKELKGRPASAAEEAPLRKKVITFAIIGLLVPILFIILGIWSAFKFPPEGESLPPEAAIDSTL